MGPKKKSKGGKGDKEKPLLTVQGVLRLERSFVTAQHADAEVIMVRKDENEEAEPMRLVPGGGEHEHVSYKTGELLFLWTLQFGKIFRPQFDFS